MEQVIERIQRYDGHHQDYDKTRIRDAAEMLVSMIDMEIGFGGQFTTIEENEVAIQTRVLGKRDVSIYKPVDQNNAPIFQKFLECAVIATTIKNQQMQEGTPLHEQMIDQVMEITKGNPLMINMGSGLISGAPVARRIYAYLSCFEDLGLLKNLLNMPTKDLKTITADVLKGTMSKEDVEILTSIGEEKAA